MIFNRILSKNRGKFPKFVLSSAENALDSNFGNFLPQNIEMILCLWFIRRAKLISPYIFYGSTTNVPTIPAPLCP
jgi:hypothetical protein